MDQSLNPAVQHLGELLAAWVGNPLFKDRPALLADDRSWTFGELEAESNRLAQVLRSSGVHRGQVVAVLLPNCPAFVLVLFAALKIGAAVSPINPAYRTPEIVHQLNDSGAVQLVADTEAAPQLMQIQDAAPALRKVWYADAEPARLDSLYHFLPDHTALPPGGPVEPADLALIMYTSGATGYPRGVELTHANVLANGRQVAAALGLDAEARAMLLLPLSHVNGIVVSTVAPLLSGGSVALRPGFAADRFWEDVDRYRPTYVSAVPTILSLLLQGNASRPADCFLRYALCSAATFSPTAARRFEDRFGLPILECYGLTEATCLVTVTPPAGTHKPGSAGPPLLGQELRIVDEQGHEVPRGQVGEVIVRGNNIMRGYHRNPAATSPALKNGWLYSGDLGYQDAEGYLFVVDRKKDMIVRGGEKVFPKEVENTLYRHPKVREVAVVGVADPILGELVKAFVVLQPEQQATPQELSDFCRQDLAPYKLPEVYEFRSSLPRDAAGKVAKDQLKQQAASPDFPSPAGRG